MGLQKIASQLLFPNRSMKSPGPIFSSDMLMWFLLLVCLETLRGLPSGRWPPGTRPGPVWNRSGPEPTPRDRERTVRWWSFSSHQGRGKGMKGLDSFACPQGGLRSSGQRGRQLGGSCQSTLCPPYLLTRGDPPQVDQLLGLLIRSTAILYTSCNY